MERGRINYRSKKEGSLVRTSQEMLKAVTSNPSATYSKKDAWGQTSRNWSMYAGLRNFSGLSAGGCNAVESCQAETQRQGASVSQRPLTRQSREKGGEKLQAGLRPAAPARAGPEQNPYECFIKQIGNSKGKSCKSEKKGSTKQEGRKRSLGRTLAARGQIVENPAAKENQGQEVDAYALPWDGDEEHLANTSPVLAHCK